MCLWVDWASAGVDSIFLTASLQVTTCGSALSPFGIVGLAIVCIPHDDD